MNLKVFIRHYRTNFRPAKENEFDWFENQHSMEAAIYNAAEARDEAGKRYSHQRRIKIIPLNNAKTELLANFEKLKSAESFHSLWLIIDQLIRPINGIGELYVYDTTLRIGVFLKLYPEKVYLHAGTRTGAKRLKIQSSNENWIVPNELPKDFQKLPMNEVEDILCIYKDDFMSKEVVFTKFCNSDVKNKKKVC